MSTFPDRNAAEPVKAIHVPAPQLRKTSGISTYPQFCRVSHNVDFDVRQKLRRFHFDAPNTLRRTSCMAAFVTKDPPR
jgi:hypothetical protein